MASNDGFARTGAAYIAQLKLEHMRSQKLAVCSNCSASDSEKSLRRCTGCQLDTYCSTNCQKQQWPRHRKFCNLVQGKGKKNAFLSAIERETCYQLLTDSYRLRAESDHAHRRQDHGLYHSDAQVNGTVWVSGDVYADIQSYLDCLELSGILPKDWSFEDRMQCLANAIDESNPRNVFQKIILEEFKKIYSADRNIMNAMFILAELAAGHDGKGAPNDNTWVLELEKFFNTHPEEKAQLISSADDFMTTLPNLGH